MINQSSISNALESLPRDQLQAICKLLLKPHFMPVFGSARVVEHEVAAFHALHASGLIGDGWPDEYTLVKTLRITKAKARNLLYAVALRSEQTEEEFINTLKLSVANPRIQLDKSAKIIAIEINDPFVMDQVRSLLRNKGYLVDGSFSESIARIPLKAFSDLLEVALGSDGLKLAKDKLRKHGVSGDLWSDMIVGIASKFSEKFAGAAGEEIGSSFGEYISSLFD